MKIRFLSIDLSDVRKPKPACPSCKKEMPSRLLAPLCINGKYSPPICGVCALRIRNKFLGLPEGMEFQGEMAQEMYKEALNYQ